MFGPTVNGLYIKALMLENRLLDVVGCHGPEVVGLGCLMVIVGYGYTVFGVGRYVGWWSER